MTLKELETLVLQIKEQVNLNTLAIQSLSNRLSDYTPIGTFYNTNVKVSVLDASVQELQNTVSTLGIDLSKVNKLASMLDTNIKDPAINEILQYDGNRWTSVKPSAVFGGGGVSKLEDLTDVKITNKSDKQSLCWDNITSKWINYTITGSGGSGSGLDIPAMWTELGRNDNTKTIHPSHITGFLTTAGGTVANLTVSGNLTTKGIVTMTNGTTAFNLLTTGISVNGSITATGELTAYKIA